MNLNQFHQLPRDNVHKNAILTALAKGAIVPVPLQRAKNGLKEIGGVGEITARQIIQAVCMLYVEQSTVENIDEL